MFGPIYGFGYGFGGLDIMLKFGISLFVFVENAVNIDKDQNLVLSRNFPRNYTFD